MRYIDPVIGARGPNYYSVSVNLKDDVLKDADTIVDGVEFMKFCTEWLVQKIVRFTSYNKNYTQNDQKTLCDCEWKEKELWILQKTREEVDENQDEHYFFDFFKFGINKKLGLGMRWFFEDDQGTSWLS